MKTRTLQITDAAGQTWPNLRGVFRREFPVVTNQVLASGTPQGVTYHREPFTVARVDRTSGLV